MNDNREIAIFISHFFQNSLKLGCSTPRFIPSTSDSCHNAPNLVLFSLFLIPLYNKIKKNKHRLSIRPVFEELGLNFGASELRFTEI